MLGKTTIMEKSAKCTAAVVANTIAMPGADDDTFSTATGVSDELIGLFQHDTSVAGAEVRVMLEGIAEIKLAGNVTRGNWLTSDSAGKGLAAAPAAGVNNNVIGKALASGVTDDVIPMLISRAKIQG
jgi:hypothetical protein